MTTRPAQADPPATVDVAIIGSGFSGLAMAVRLKRAGNDDFVLLERGDEVGGTWRDNSYPGCACDVPSLLYSFSFAPNPDWSSTFSPQPEIWAYLRRVARDEGILPHVRFAAEVLEARWDPARERWQVATSRGEVSARALVSAAGALADPAIPDLPGVDRFQGTVFHSARWDHAHDLTGESVAVIGTGASAIQFVPQVQPLVDRLHLFQRTAPWILPRRERPLTGLERAVYRRLPAVQRMVRAAIFWTRELLAIPLLNASLAPLTTRLASGYLRQQVPDRELRRKLRPRYAPGCKRVLISNDYYPAVTQANVDVVTDGVAEVRAHSIVTTDGTERQVDTIIFGTGFHVTDFPIAHRLHDAQGVSLAEHWSGGAQAHRGTTVAGFPNLFLLLGPNTGLGHTSVVLMAEAQVGYVMRALKHMKRTGSRTLEVRREAQESWNARIQAATRGTVWTAGGCASWYLDAAGRNTTLWPGFVFRFRMALARFDASNYRVAEPVAPRVIVTGAAGGIGAAAVAELRRRGARVVGLDRRAAGEGVLACDVTDQASVDLAVAAAIERLGGLDVLINNAGVGDPQGAGERPDATALRVIDVNLVGPWRVTAAALPALRESRGRVVNVASGLVHLSVPMATAYSMSKRGLVAYSDALRVEHGDALAVTTVYPGYIRTPIHDAARQQGLSLEGVVPAETIAGAARALARAALGRPVRNIATSWWGGAGYRLLSLLPKRLVDREVSRRFARLQRSRSYVQTRAEIAATSAQPPADAERPVSVTAST